ncbi:MAG: hypothetical protein OEY63_00405 [Gemmatimonadota bacterium]|nr:hypothetical protein [Gemmatimonadota bacterium]MDH5803543.1 hypothetical protein [Gemmatimonadota bacterium]
MAREGYVPVANLEVTTVAPTPHGFELQGMGADNADYLMEMHLDIPIDAKTRAVLAEMLSQSEWNVSRRATTPLKAKQTRRSPASRRGIASGEV